MPSGHKPSIRVDGKLSVEVEITFPQKARASPFPQKPISPGPTTHPEPSCHRPAQHPCPGAHIRKSSKLAPSRGLWCQGMDFDTTAAIYMSIGTAGEDRGCHGHALGPRFQFVRLQRMTAAPPSARGQAWSSRRGFATIREARTSSRVTGF